MTSDARHDMRAALTALAAHSQDSGSSVTSDLSIDETLLLHSMGYEPVDLVTGVSIVAIPYGTFIVPYGQSDPIELPGAVRPVGRAFDGAADRLREACVRAHGFGVVGVEIEVEVGTSMVSVSVAGTAVRPIDRSRRQVGRPFVTDLSVRDFLLLERAGWEPLGLAVGAGFVAAPYQGIRQSIAFAGQNRELPAMTQALQIAREGGMEQMQSAGSAMGASGIVGVRIDDGPLGHSRHVCAFICYGTAVRLVGAEHRRIEPDPVVPIDDIGDVAASSIY